MPICHSFGATELYPYYYALLGSHGAIIFSLLMFYWSIYGTEATLLVNANAIVVGVGGGKPALLSLFSLFRDLLMG